MSKGSSRVVPFGEFDGRFAEPHARPKETVTAVDRWLAARLVAAVGGRVYLELWDGERIVLSGTQPRCGFKLTLRSALYWLLRNPKRYFGDLYSLGVLEVGGNLVEFLEGVYDGFEASSRRPWARLWRDTRPRSTSRQAARENIHHHYDLGNEFYALWLDRDAMQYTCGYFPEPGLSLEAGQRAKMHHICRKLCLQPDQEVIEAGCGWGGLALFMAREYGVRVRAYNISHEQIVFARERAREAGLHDRVEYVEDDYRNIEGRCDVFVSVGMLEHVGVRHYGELGAVIDRTLKPDGGGLIHTIGRNRPQRMNSWIEARIFPGAYPPTLAEMAPVFTSGNLAVQDVENLRLHYAETLRHWRDRFEAHRAEIEGLYGPPFVRAWRLYLCGSIAAFTSGALQLFQVRFNRARGNKLPRSRAHTYTGEAPLEFGDG